MGLAKSHLMQSEYDHALRELQRLNQADAVPPAYRGEFFKLIGIIYSGKKDWDVAITFFRKYEKECSNQLDPLASLYSAYLSAGDEDTAILTLRRIVSRFPEQGAFALKLMNHLIKRKDRITLKQTFDQLLSAIPRDLNLYNFIGQACLEAGMYAHGYLYLIEAKAHELHFNQREHPAYSRWIDYMLGPCLGSADFQTLHP